MPTVLNQAKPRARKAHRCDLCLIIIEPGEVYDRQTCIWDGNLYDWKSCRGTVGCNVVSRAIFDDPHWAPDYYDEGLDSERAYEWAMEQVRFTGSMLAGAYLTRREVAHRQWSTARKAGR